VALPPGPAQQFCRAAALVLLLVLASGGLIPPVVQAVPPRSAAEDLRPPDPLALPLLPPQPQPAAGGKGSGDRDLQFVESLYRAGDSFRAESEILRLLHRRPGDPLGPRLELARAKLYHRAGRYGESRLLLLSLLDRHPGSQAAPPARQLLELGRMRLEPPAPDSPAAPPGSISPQRAVRHSTFVPGAGFMLTGQPGKAALTLGLNLAFLGGAWWALQSGLPGPALMLALMDVSLYQGQRNAAREAALRHNERLLGVYLEKRGMESGERELLSQALLEY